jgi:hypothetical protein
MDAATQAANRIDWFALSLVCAGGYLSLVATLAIPWAFSVWGKLCAADEKNKSQDNRIGKVEKRVDRIEDRLGQLTASPVAG